MKPSQYNHIFDIEDGKGLLFNSASGALAEIETDIRPRIEFLLTHSDRAETDRDRELLSGLTEGGYLIDDRIDELGLLKARSRIQRLEGATLSLTIAPTLACNFCCDYCFESQSNIRMKPETEQALLLFADREMDRADKLLVAWFGGEPTLCLPTIERVQRGLADLGEAHKIKVHPASIVTNGYLLDGAMATRLKALGIVSAQVTIDGPEAVHDRRRRLHSGHGTYHRILENLVESSSILQMSVRINVDRENVASACEVLEELGRLGILGKVQVHFAQVTTSNRVCADMRDRCFSGEEFSRSQVDLYRALIDHGIYQYEYPQVIGGVHCGAMSDHYFVIAPNGLLFRCWEELSHDPAYSIGSIFSDQADDQQKDNISRYRTWDPFKKAECRACQVLPICLGGCPLLGMREGHPERGACAPWKFNLREMLHVRYLCETQKGVTP